MTKVKITQNTITELARVYKRIFFITNIHTSERRLIPRFANSVLLFHDNNTANVDFTNACSFFVPHF